MAAPTVYLDGLEISVNCIEEAHLIFDIESLYATGVLVIKDPGGSLFSLIKRGSEVLILYEGTSGKSLIKHPMRVLSYDKQGSREAATLDRTHMVLISEWYYLQINYTRAFFGTVSQIVDRVLKTDTWFSDVKLEASSDSTRIRYQLGQTNAEYLAAIKKYAVADGSPMYMFTNRKRELCLLSRKTIDNETPKYRIAPYLDIKEQDRANSGLPMLAAMALSFESKGEKAAAKKNYRIPVRNATEKEQASARPFITLDSKEGSATDAVALPTPEDIRLSSWTLSPAEAAAVATNTVAKEELDLFCVVAVVTNILTTSMDLGSVAEVDMNTDCSENGNYFVKHIDLIYNGGQSFTKLMLVRR